MKMMKVIIVMRMRVRVRRRRKKRRKVAVKKEAPKVKIVKIAKRHGGIKQEGVKDWLLMS